MLSGFGSKLLIFALERVEFEPSSLFLSEVLVLTQNLLNLKNYVTQVGRRIAFTARGLESFQESSAT